MRRPEPGAQPGDESKEGAKLTSKRDVIEAARAAVNRVHEKADPCLMCDLEVVIQAYDAGRAERKAKRGELDVLVKPWNLAGKCRFCGEPNHFKAESRASCRWWLAKGVLGVAAK